ncbi:MAG: gluconolactonase [Pirellulaceae bacterium]|nr:MAG: gluconolactonase [Pirellulaceae bacterium]GIW96276.1 MAG: gluconolactonase [Pirellulaceae bacterium]
MPEPPVYNARLWFDPQEETLKYLPEGPRVCSAEQISWVAIQHGAEATYGSVNLLSIGPGLQITEYRSYALNGRPGFAFPTTVPGCFLVGLERQLVLCDVATGKVQPLAEPVDQEVEGTIINDAQMFGEGVVFGTKDLKFAEPKANLYLYRSRDGAVIRLRDKQTCSNGKILSPRADGSWTLLDIDTPRKQIVQYRLDATAGVLEEERVVVDLTEDPAFPDGMVASPDGNSLLVALYNPHPAAWGEVRQYGIESGECEAVWRVPGSPQVTCPQLFYFEGKVHLVITTAVEHMAPDRRREAHGAGCLFVMETSWNEPLPRVAWDIDRRAAIEIPQ